MVGPHAELQLEVTNLNIDHVEQSKTNCAMSTAQSFNKVGDLKILQHGDTQIDNT
jgi:hypothetical protein